MLCLDICVNSFECEFGLDREKCRIREMLGDIQQIIHDNLSARTLEDFVCFLLIVHHYGVVLCSAILHQFYEL